MKNIIALLVLIACAGEAFSQNNPDSACNFIVRYRATPDGQEEQARLVEMQKLDSSKVQIERVLCFPSAKAVTDWLNVSNAVEETEEARISPADLIGVFARNGNKVEYQIETRTTTRQRKIIIEPVTRTKSRWKKI